VSGEQAAEESDGSDGDPPRAKEVAEARRTFEQRPQSGHAKYPAERVNASHLSGVLQFLDVSDFASAGRCCKAWYAAAALPSAWPSELCRSLRVSLIDTVVPLTMLEQLPHLPLWRHANSVGLRADRPDRRVEHQVLLQRALRAIAAMQRVIRADMRVQFPNDDYPNPGTYRALLTTLNSVGPRLREAHFEWLPPGFMHGFVNLRKLEVYWMPCGDNSGVLSDFCAPICDDLDGMAQLEHLTLRTPEVSLELAFSLRRLVLRHALRHLVVCRAHRGRYSETGILRDFLQLLAVLSGQTTTEVKSGAASAAATLKDKEESGAVPLETLALDGMKPGELDNWYPALLLPELQELTLEWRYEPGNVRCEAPATATQPPPAARTLRRLELIGRLNIAANFTVLATPLRVCELEEICLKGAWWEKKDEEDEPLGEDTLLAWAAHLHKLRKIHLDQVHVASQLSAVAAFARMPALRELVLRRQWKLTRRCLPALAEATQLEALRLNDIPQWPLLHRGDSEDNKAVAVVADDGEARVRKQKEAASAAAATAAKPKSAGAMSSVPSTSSSSAVPDVATLARRLPGLCELEVGLGFEELKDAAAWTRAHFGPAKRKADEKGKAPLRREAARIRQALRQLVIERQQQCAATSNASCAAPPMACLQRPSDLRVLLHVFDAHDELMLADRLLEMPLLLSGGGVPADPPSSVKAGPAKKKQRKH